MSHEADQVRKFYEVIWNRHDKSAVPEVLHPEFTFRGSLGVEKRGCTGFCEYLDMVHEALADYQCLIDDLVCEPEKAFAKMTFTGVHRGVFMGVPPTGRKLSWSGAALFRFTDGRVSSLWVLGDLKSLEMQLQED